jgi:hypothetical protein
MPMSVFDLKIGQMAVSYARKCTPKSVANIPVPNVSEEEEVRRQDKLQENANLARFVTGQILAMAGFAGTSGLQTQVDVRLNIRQAVNQFTNEGNTPVSETSALVTNLVTRKTRSAGACQELAYAAFVYLRNLAYPRFCLVSVSMAPYALSADARHAFVIMGSPGANPTVESPGKQGDFVIVDPWLSAILIANGATGLERLGVYFNSTIYADLGEEYVLFGRNKPLTVMLNSI